MDLKDLIAAYEEQNDCPFDFMEELVIPEEMTYGAAVDLYVQFMHEVDGDIYYRATDDMLFNMVTGEEVVDMGQEDR